MRLSVPLANREVVVIGDNRPTHWRDLPEPPATLELS